MTVANAWRKAVVLAAITGAAAAWGLLAASPVRGGEEPPDAKQLYQEFEGLNTEENLGKRFVGGQPPGFIRRQGELLEAIAARPPADAVPLLLRVAAEHLERVEALRARDFRQSPLQAIQAPIVEALSRFAANDEVRGALGRLARSATVKEYARGRALDTLAGHFVARIAEADDPKGEQRAKVLLGTLLGSLTLPELFQAPARVRAVARRGAAIAPADAAAAWQALAAAADSPAQRYAADAALSITCAQKEIKGEPIMPREKDLLAEACSRWLKDYRPVAEKQKYPSDLLGESLLRLGARLGHEPLARPLRDAKLIPPQ